MNKRKIYQQQFFFIFFQSQRQFPLVFKQMKRTDSLCVRLIFFLIIKWTENIFLPFIKYFLYAHKLSSGQHWSNINSIFEYFEPLYLSHFHILQVHLNCLTSELLRITCHPAILISSVSFTGSCRNPPSPCVYQKSIIW